jgi:hypothetical protein
MVRTGTWTVRVNTSGKLHTVYTYIYYFVNINHYTKLVLCACLFRVDGRLRVGRVYLYGVVSYTCTPRERTDAWGIRLVTPDEYKENDHGTELFVMIMPYTPSGFISKDYTGAYTYKKSATTDTRNRTWVHVSSLCTYMYIPKGIDKDDDYNKETVKIVPVCKAYVQD